MKKKIGLAVAVAILPLSATTAQQPQAPALTYEYAVKIVCGTSTMQAINLPLVMPGAYATAVNVHNPNLGNEVTYKFAVATLALPGKMTSYKGFFGMKYDEAFDLDCRTMRNFIGANGGGAVGPFFTGFLVIQAHQELDVVAVYTAAPGANAQVASIHTERVPKRQVK